MRIPLLYFILAFALNLQSAHAQNADPGQTPLDPTLAPKSEEEVSNVFREMGVVQKRAMPKGGRWLVSSFATLDFSDGPYSYYSLHVNPGYAINDFFEVYANFVPYYLIQPRSIVGKLAALNLTVTAAQPKFQYGLELLWAPLYGKDSVGISRVLRSDTFVKLDGSIISFDTGDTGMSLRLGVGKSFFLTRSAGFRFCIDYGYVQSIVGVGTGLLVKSFSSLLLTEFGMTFYL